MRLALALTAVLALGAPAHAARTLVVTVPALGHAGSGGWYRYVNFSVTNLTNTSTHPQDQTVDVKASASGTDCYVIVQPATYNLDVLWACNPGPNVASTSCWAVDPYRTLTPGQVRSYIIDLQCSVAYPYPNNGLQLSFTIQEDRGAVAATGILGECQSSGTICIGSSLSINGGRPF